MKEKVMEILAGDVTITKKELLLAVTGYTLLGVVIGLIAAPFTHGVTIGCHNGNNNGNDATNHIYDNEETDEETQCVGVCECHK